MSYGGGEVAHWQRAGSSVPVVLALYEAMRDGQAEDVLALVDPEVTYKPLDHSELSVYRGHEGMLRLMRDLHATFGDYHLNIVDMTEEPGPRVTMLAWVIPGPARGLQFPVRLMYAFSDGLATSIESLPPPAA